MVVSRLLRGQRQMTVDNSVSCSGRRRHFSRTGARCCAAAPASERMHPHLDRSQIDVGRFILSNKKIAGRHPNDLRRRYGATISASCGDVDIVPTTDLVLELGDQVRSSHP